MLTATSVTPVPFNLPQEFDAKCIDENMKVPCFLQYWDPLANQFVIYSQFCLSENEPADLDLPQLGSEDKVKVQISAIWRVVITKPDGMDVDEFVFPL